MGFQEIYTNFLKCRHVGFIIYSKPVFVLFECLVGGASKQEYGVMYI